MPKRRSLENAGISDAQYLQIMERVAEQNYKDWGLLNSDAALIQALNDNTYDYKGYYNKYPNSRANASTHWTDEFKTVYHPTFSKESKYSGKKSQYNPKGLVGGTWYGEYFVPSVDLLIERNKFEKGGSAKKSVTTGGAGYVPDSNTHDVVQGIKTAGKKILNKFRQALYNRVDPYSYDIGEAFSQLFYKGRETKKNDVYDALWARYLNRSNADVGYNVDDYLQPATYKPNKGTPVGQLYRLAPKSWDGNEDLNPLGDIQLYQMLKSGRVSDLGDGVGGTQTGLGTYTRSLGEDEKGKYMSYYDEWDISPIGNKSGKEGKDQTFGIGTPFSVYDRRYYTDEEAKHIISEYDKFYQSVKDAAKNQSIKHEIYSPKPYRAKKSSGGSIHIAPSKRGTFTAAATERGMSVQEFASRVLRNKDNYSPAMVKKANFARNASKWHH